MAYASGIAHIVAQRTLTPSTPDIRHIVMSRIRTGSSILQTPGAINSELDQINDDVLAFSKELTEHVTTQAGYPHSDPRPPIEAFFANVWTPWYIGWEAWLKTYRGWWTNFWWNHAPHAEEYLDQLIQLREQARTLGMDVMSPEPKKPPPGLVEGFLAILLSILKTGLLLAVGVGAIAIIISWVRH